MKFKHIDSYTLLKTLQATQKAKIVSVKTTKGYSKMKIAIALLVLFLLVSCDNPRVYSEPEIVQGEQGIQGLQGEKGEQGIAGVNGKDGKNGTNGANGVNGKDGVDGTNGAKGHNGSNIVTGQGLPDDLQGQNGDSYVDSETGDLYARVDGVYVLQGNLKGLQGNQGEVGEQGEQGIDGQDGVNGTNGEAGQDGTQCKVGQTDNGAVIKCDNGTGAEILNGKNGNDGSDGTNGVDGRNGLNGTNGIDGKDGVDGKNGIDGEDGVILTNVKVLANTCTQVADRIWIENIQNGRIYDVYANENCRDSEGEFCDNVVASFGSSGVLSDTNHQGSATVCLVDENIEIAARKLNAAGDLVINIKEYEL